MTVQWFDVVGAAGVAVIVGCYILLQTERNKSEHLSYSLLNAAGALLILISLIFAFNLPSFIVESFWLLISLYGIGKWFLRQN
ncbi:MAG: hypothetical protein HS105_11880 [Chloracidobacterium sp.]|nr:hypothetical protein [Chloracidobacterium sp.]MCO5332986.1 hypothetical protein [Pyrinomonadaceae bacterium]